MIGRLRDCGICRRGGLLAALLVAAVLVCSQAACLSHVHCVETGCFEDDQRQVTHECQTGCDGQTDHIEDVLEPCTGCWSGHHGHDMHHHLRDGHANPQRKLISPFRDFPEAAAEAVGIPDLPVSFLPYLVYGTVTPDRPGSCFEGRAPPLC